MTYGIKTQKSNLKWKRYHFACCQCWSFFSLWPFLSQDQGHGQICLKTYAENLYGISRKKT